MHPHTQAYAQIKTLRISSCISPPPPAPVQPPAAARAFGFYLSCVQAQASVKRAEETSAASALSSGWETHASIMCNIALLGPLCVFEQMDGEAGDDIQQHLGSSITPSWELILKIKKKE